MVTFARLVFFAALSTTFSQAAVADMTAYQLEQLIGWTIIDSKTIEGYRDDGEDKESDWEGCDFGRTVYFLDGTSVTCNSFGYQYSFMPKAILFGRSMTYQGKQHTLYKMLVDGQLYDVY